MFCYFKVNIFRLSRQLEPGKVCGHVQIVDIAEYLSRFKLVLNLLQFLPVYRRPLQLFQFFTDGSFRLLQRHTCRRLTADLQQTRITRTADVRVDTGKDILFLYQAAVQTAGTSVAENIGQNIECVIIRTLATAHVITHEQGVQRHVSFHRQPAFLRLLAAVYAAVLRLRRPFVVVDEAHNSRTELAFDMLARFRPSGVMELTATPDLERTPSNVLHSVSAAELKAEEMIKLPVVLETEPNWQQCLADAIGRRDALHKLADEERRAGAAYLRPLVLIQSEPRRAGIETLDFEKVKNELITNHGIPASEIVVATGEEKGLEQIDADYPLGMADPACPVKFVITQKALAEGWDCPFAYILVSMASMSSSTAVEQLLGRVLRQPGASQRASPLLNQSYAFVVSRNFAETAAATPPALINGEMHLPYCRFSRMVLPLQFRIFHSSMPYVANASPSLPDGS